MQLMSNIDAISRVISLKALKEFWGKHNQAEKPLRAWHDVIRTKDYSDLNDLKRTFSTADYVPPYTVFDIGGNKYRVIARVQYKDASVYIIHVFTHAEYDKWSAGNRK